MLRNHPQRDVLEKELQQRFFPPLPCPCRIGHFMLTLNSHSRADELAQLQQLAASQGKILSESDTDLELQWPNLWLRWEKHTEFSTYSFVEPGNNAGFGPIEQLLPSADFLTAYRGNYFASCSCSSSTRHGLNKNPTANLPKRIVFRACSLATKREFGPTFASTQKAAVACYCGIMA